MITILGHEATLTIELATSSGIFVEVSRENAMLRAPHKLR
jgi:hypothetical protein